MKLKIIKVLKNVSIAGDRSHGRFAMKRTYGKGSVVAISEVALKSVNPSVYQEFDAESGEFLEAGKKVSVAAPKAPKAKAKGRKPKANKEAKKVAQKAIKMREEHLEKIAKKKEKPEGITSNEAE